MHTVCLLRAVAIFMGTSFNRTFAPVEFIGASRRWKSKAHCKTVRARQSTSADEDEADKNEQEGTGKRRTWRKRRRRRRKTTITTTAKRMKPWGHLRLPNCVGRRFSVSDRFFNSDGTNLHKYTYIMQPEIIKCYQKIRSITREHTGPVGWFFDGSVHRRRRRRRRSLHRPRRRRFRCASA